MLTTKLKLDFSLWPLKRYQKVSRWVTESDTFHIWLLQSLHPAMLEVSPLTWSAYQALNHTWSRLQRFLQSTEETTQAMQSRASRQSSDGAVSKSKARTADSTMLQGLPGQAPGPFSVLLPLDDYSSVSLKFYSQRAWLLTLHSSSFPLHSRLRTVTALLRQLWNGKWHRHSPPTQHGWMISSFSFLLKRQLLLVIIEIKCIKVSHVPNF